MHEENPRQGAGMGIGMLLRLAAAEPFLFLATASAFVPGLGRASSVVSVGGAADGSGNAAAAALHAHIDRVADAATSCESNSSHVGWIRNDGTAVHVVNDEARSRMTDYLWTNIMPYDVPNALTLGFDPEGSPWNGDDDRLAAISRDLRRKNDTAMVDGLSDGILNQTLHYSLRAKALYPWTDSVPRSVYMEYVVPYAVVNEPRSDHRPLLFHALREMLKDYERPARGGRSDVRLWGGAARQTPRAQIKEAVKLINTRLWSALGRPDQPVEFKAGLTPRIYDPLSVIAYGHSSCTGLAVLLVSALRSVGIPARMAGTPAWKGEEENGNHSWVEVFLPGTTGGGEGGWIFLEPTPGIAEGNEDTADADDTDRDPCARWFCDADRFDGSTEVYATRFDKEAADVNYPMAWAVGDEGVPGADRSEYYTKICGKCT